MRTIATLSAMLLGAAAPVRDPQWWLLGRDETYRVLIFVDEASISGTNTKRAWTDWIAQRPIEDNPQETRTYFEFDCIGVRHRILSNIIYSWHGGSRNDTPEDPKWKPTAPGTQAHNVLRAVCDYIPRRVGSGPFLDPVKESSRLFRLFDEADEAR